MSEPILPDDTLAELQRLVDAEAAALDAALAAPKNSAKQDAHAAALAELAESAGDFCGDLLAEIRRLRQRVAVLEAAGR